MPRELELMIKAEPLDEFEEKIQEEIDKEARAWDEDFGTNEGANEYRRYLQGVN